MLKLLVAQLTPDFLLIATQLLIGEPVMQSEAPPCKRGRVLRIVTLRFIWWARNSKAVQFMKIPMIATKAKIWQDTKQNLHNKWRNWAIEQKNATKAKKGLQSSLEAQCTFNFNFGCKTEQSTMWRAFLLSRFNLQSPNKLVHQLGQIVIPQA